MNSRMLRRLVSVLFALVAWAVLAPTVIGGTASYVTVQGRSMLPNIEPGDLVMLVHRGDYHVGDVIAYKAQNMAGAVIIHRIIETNGGRFTTKGDNNDFIDAYRPTPDDVLGQQRLRVPNGASVIDILRSPIGFSLIIATTALLLLRSIASGRPRHRHRHRAMRGIPSSVPAIPVQHQRSERARSSPSAGGRCWPF